MQHGEIIKNDVANTRMANEAVYKAKIVAPSPKKQTSKDYIVTFSLECRILSTFAFVSVYL